MKVTFKDYTELEEIAKEYLQRGLEMSISPEFILKWIEKSRSDDEVITELLTEIWEYPYPCQS